HRTRSVDRVRNAEMHVLALPRRRDDQEDVLDGPVQLLVGPDVLPDRETDVTRTGLRHRRPYRRSLLLYGGRGEQPVDLTWRGEAEPQPAALAAPAKPEHHPDDQQDD